VEVFREACVQRLVIDCPLSACHVFPDKTGLATRISRSAKTRLDFECQSKILTSA
jgi:hypothetical protein